VGHFQIREGFVAQVVLETAAVRRAHAGMLPAMTRQMGAGHSVGAGEAFVLMELLAWLFVSLEGISIVCMAV
jgi:hypothetical protein